MTDQHALFNEYFQIEHSIRINLLKGGHSTSLPSNTEFEANIPLPFKIASEMKGLEQTMVKPLRQLGDAAEPLAHYLKAQSRKIDLMMNYLLQSEDEPEYQHYTLSYGGGGFRLITTEPLEASHWYQCKLFFDDEAAAIFCYANLLAVEPSANSEGAENAENTEGHLNTLVFSHLREDDREIILRAALHQQSKQLLKKAQSR